MKTKLNLKLLCRCALLTSTLCLPAVAQPTIITYQGQMYNNGTLANGSYDMTFTFYSVPSNGIPLIGPITNAPVAVSNGLFTVNLTAGSSNFNFGISGAHFLEIAACTNGSAGPYSVLSPRQLLADTPYAIAAQTAVTAGTATTAATANSVAANSITAPDIEPGQVVKSLNGLEDAVTIAAGANLSLTTNGNVLTFAGTGGGGGGSSNAWLLAGNIGTSPTNGNFVGTIDNQPLELRVHGQRALRLDPDNTTGGSPNVV